MFLVRGKMVIFFSDMVRLHFGEWEKKFSEKCIVKTKFIFVYIVLGKNLFALLELG